MCIRDRPSAIQMKNTTQVIIASELIRYTQNTTPRMGIKGMSGTLNVRSSSGRARHRAMTPKLTIANAARVPIDVASAS